MMWHKYTLAVNSYRNKEHELEEMQHKIPHILASSFKTSTFVTFNRELKKISKLIKKNKQKV